MISIEIFLIAFAMSIDAFSVSFAVGCSYHKPRHYFRLGWHFGLFQFVMPLLGALLGKIFVVYTQRLNILGSFILFFIAYNMLKESIKNDQEKCYLKDPTKGISLIMLSVATSMDALGVGLTLPLLKGGILINSGIIGIVCVMFSVLGVFLGSRSRHFFGRFAEKAGAFVLFGIGIKFLVV